MENRQEFCGKIILFGEYTVILDGVTLAMPSRNYSGIWTQDVEESIDLLPYIGYLKENLKGSLDVDRLYNDYGLGFSFKSSIPMGYGLGSSGALVAAIYTRYCLNADGDKDEIRSILGKMESFFHGQSSGTDPLISYMDSPLLMDKKGIRKVEISDETLVPFRLLDSQRERQSEPLVASFLERMKGEAYKADVETYQEIVKTAIKAVLNNDVSQLESSIQAISRAQLVLFQDMIPAKIRALWVSGLEAGTYSMKLCGAGGGGMFLLYLHESDKVLESISYSISYL